MERILHVLARTPVGGVGSFLMNTENTISKKYKFDYLILEDVNKSQFIQFVEKRGSKVYLIDEKLSLTNYSKIRDKIDNLLNNVNYRIVHIHSPNIATLVLPIFKKHNIPIRILHSHSTKYSDNKLKSIRNYLIELPMYNYTTHLIACSEVAGKFLFGKKKYTVIYNGIDTNRFHYKSTPKGNNKCIIGHVGNFVPVKNHDYIIKVFKNLSEINDKYELWLFGDGETKARIQEEVNHLNLSEKVKFYGRVPDIENYYDKIDLLLLPSLYEGFPVAAMEAQAHGLPIIASTNVTTEIDFYGDDLFLDIKEREIKTWVEAIINLGSSNKKEKSEKFIKSEFNIEETTKKLEKFYDNCISELSLNK